MKLDNYPYADLRTKYLSQYDYKSPSYVAARGAMYWILEEMDKCLEEQKAKIIENIKNL